MFSQAVRNKELDMKGGAEWLGVSYGTLYGRYREVFGYLKHGGNYAAAAGPSTSSSSSASAASHLRFPQPSEWATYSKKHRAGGAAADLDHQEIIFEQLKSGRINLKQAGALLGIDTTLLATQLAGKVREREMAMLIDNVDRIYTNILIRFARISTTVPAGPSSPRRRRTMKTGRWRSILIL